MVERSNIIIDGNGYTLQGTGAYASKGINLSSRSSETSASMQNKIFSMLVPFTYIALSSGMVYSPASFKGGSIISFVFIKYLSFKSLRNHVIFV